MRILVIGGTRFIGPPTVLKLQGRGHEVTVFHRGATGKPPCAEILGDRRRLPEYAKDLRRLQPDVVVDMISLIEEDARQVAEVFSGHAGRLVLISSMDVYLAFGCLIGLEDGPPISDEITEESPLRSRLYPYRGEQPRPADDPKRIYDDYDKIPNEAIALNTEGLPGTVLRLPMVYGPGDYQHRIFGYLKRMDDGRPILIDAPTSRWRTARGYVEDVAEAICLAAMPQASGRVYNVCEKDALTELEWINAIAAAADIQPTIHILDSERMPSHLRQDAAVENQLIVSSAAIRQDLGYEEAMPLRERIAQTVAWERENPHEFEPGEFDYSAEDRAVSGDTS
jgi:nucleoside-diphosphate-sugar epimerase